MPATTTIPGHVQSAIDFYKKEQKFFSIGKTSPWSYDPENPYTDNLTSDVNPPEADPSGNLIELVGYKRVESAFLVAPAESGEIEYNDHYWKIATEENAKELGAHYVCLSTWITHRSLPTDFSYRQIGVVLDIKPKEGIDTNKEAYLVNEIEDQGTVYGIFNRTPVPRDISQSEEIIVILEF